MAPFTRSEAAERAGISASDLDRLIELGLVSADSDGSFSTGAVRKAAFLVTLEKRRVAPSKPCDPR